MALFFLVGFMGSGKTTLGINVAHQLSLPFFDLDEEIATSAGMTITDMFESFGEEGFRQLESQALAQLIKKEKHGIVASGGGTYTIAYNRKLINKAGLSVWIDVPIEILLERVQPKGRPMWKNEMKVRQLADSREKYYRSAELHLNLKGESIKESSSKLYQLLSPYVNN